MAGIHTTKADWQLAGNGESVEQAQKGAGGPGRIRWAAGRLRRRAPKIASPAFAGVVLVLLFAGVLVVLPTAANAGPSVGDLKQVNITVERVDIVHTTDLAVKGQVITLAEPLEQVDLLPLQSGVFGGLGIVAIPPGFVIQIRLVVSSASIVFDSDVAGLTIPSGKIKLDGVFEVPGDNDVAFDLDADKHFKVTRAGFRFVGVIEFCPVRAGVVRCPDLIVETLTHAPATPTTTDLITFTAVVKNVGEAIAGKSTLNFRVGGETFGIDFAIPFLAPGETFTAQRQEVLDVAQNYQNTATADVDEEVAESREDNNVTTDFYTVTT